MFYLIGCLISIFLIMKATKEEEFKEIAYVYPNDILKIVLVIMVLGSWLTIILGLTLMYREKD